MSKFVKDGETSSCLIVEGKGDLEVVSALLGSSDAEFSAREIVGIGNLKSEFKNKLKATNYLKKLWVLVDADADCGSRWQMLRDKLIEHGGYDVTPKTALPKDGAIFKPKDAYDITVGVWVMPDNEHPGMLEDFVASLVCEGDTLIGIASDVVENLDAEREKHPSLFKAVHTSKAKIHTWLAWQDPPGISVGTAILKHRISTDAPLCEAFVAWLEKLRPDYEL